jgi:hypothetical protein
MRTVLQRWLDALRRKLYLARLPNISADIIENGRQLWSIDRRLRRVQEALGRIENRQLAAAAVPALGANEFRVYSQWGEDGIIQHLLRHVPIERRIFVEFGVEDYEEANTRFLLTHDNWAGLVIDGDPDNIARLKSSQVYWLHNLKALHAFITRENINALLRDNGVDGEIGLLSIDVDGMDYWIWEAIDSVEPAIVVIEYNSLFGPHEALTVPYDPAFDRRRAHHSLIYYGASLKALWQLGQRKGYALVGCGSAGLNAFFVRRDRLRPPLEELSAEQAYVQGQFCEAHDDQGQRVKMTHAQQAELLRTLPLVRLEAQGT